MHVQIEEQPLVIFTFKDFNFRNIGPRKRCVKTPDCPFLNSVSLRSDENNNKSVLRVGNLNLMVEI